MADMQTLLDLAGKGQNLGVNPNGSMIDRIAPQPLKQQSVANAASTKQAELSQKVEQPIDYYKVAAGAGTDVGLLGQKGPEYDLRTMTPAELQEKYGYATTIDMLANKLTAKQNYRNDQEAPRSGMEMLTDTALAVESGVMGGIGGLSSWALSGVAPEASVAIAEGTNRATDFLNDFTSDTAKGALRASETRSGLSYADNEYMRQAESEAGASDTVASLRKFGRDTVDAAESLGNSDTAFAQGTSQAVGSFVSGGPLAKALRAGGALVVGGEKSLNLAKTLGALDKANGVTSTARGINAVNKVGDFLTWPAVTAALEGGGAYTGVVNEINNLSYAELAKTSPVYQAKLAELLKSKKYSLSDAQAMAKEFAVVDTAQTAAMRQAPIAAALGMVTKYGEKPFKAPSVRDGLKNVLVKEPLEESTQGLTGQLNQNLAIQQNIDKETDLSKGVGRQFVEGAAYGLSAAGVSQAPSIATLGAINTGISAYNATRGLLAKSGSIGNLILDKADAYLAAREKDSPIAEETLAEMSTVAASGGIDQIESAVNAAIDASSSSTEEKVKTKEYMASLVKAFKLDPKELEAFPDNLKADIDPANGRVVAVQQLARKVQTLTGPEQLEAAASMYALMDTMHGVQYSDPEALSSLSEDDPTRQELSHYEQVITNILNTPSIKTALLKLAEQGKAVEEAAPQIIENNAIQSPEAQAILQSTLAIASVSPEHGNVETINNLLKHSDEKRLNLTAEQRATLSNSIELIKARQAIERGISAGGLSRLQDVVSEQVIGSNDGARKGQWPSLVQHTKQIIDAMHSKNKDLATERIAELGLFLQHMENKVKAANKHFEERNSDKPPKYVPYQVLMPITREWGSSENNPKANHKGMFVNTKSEASFDLVQSAALERDIVAGVFNNFTKAFPTLGIKAIKPTPLNPELVGVPSELVKKFNPNVVKPTGGSLVDKLNASLQPTTPVVASPVVPTDTKTLTPLEQAVELGIDQIAKKIYEDGGTIFDIITKLGDKLSEESFPTEKAKIKFLGDVLEAMGAVAPYTAPINTLSKEYAEFAERAINWLNKNKDKLSEKGIQTLADLQNNPTNEEVSNIRKDFKNADMLQAVTETPADVASEEVTPTVVVKKVTKKAKVNPPAPAVETKAEPKKAKTPESTPPVEVIAPVAPVVPVIKAPEKPIRKEGLNDGQKVAYEKAISFYNSDKKTFSIAGPAGSGKTFLVTSVINALRKANAGMKIVLSSPTHRANTVTRVKNPNDTVKTLHVLLGLRPNVDLSKFNAKDVQFNQGSELDDKFPNNALIIVDESSMINDELYAFLMEKVNAANGTKIIFLGDNAQLAPVNQLTPSKALTSTDDGAVLTEIMRTEDPALLDESTAVRESGSFTYKSDMKDGKGVSFTNSAKSFVELAINMFGSPAFKTNPLLVRVVAFTNNRVEKFNEVIRLGLFGENPPSYVVGELLMGYSSFGKAIQKDGLTPVANGVDYIVQELVSSKVETIFGVDVTIETIKIKDIFGLEDAQTIKILSPKTPKETVKELGLAAAAVIKRAQKDRQVWKREFYPVTDTYAFPFDIEYGRGKDGKPLVAMKSTLQYGYAHTIHKSQGGTYTYAMVDDQDIEASRASPSDKQKLRYVGLTRAQQGTYVYTSATLANSLGKKAVAPNLAVAPETTTPATPATTTTPTTPAAEEDGAVAPTKKPVEQLTADDWSAIIGYIEGPARPDAPHETHDTDTFRLLKKMVIKIIKDGVKNGTPRERIIQQIEGVTKGGIKTSAMNNIHSLLDAQTVNASAPAVEAAVSTEDTYTRESLKKLSVDELKAIATTLGLEFKPKVTANRLIKDILVEQAKLEKEEEAFDALIDAAPSLQTFQRGDPDLTEEQRKQLAVVYQIRYETAMENPIAWEIPQNDSVIEIKETTSSQYGPRTTINARSAGVTIAVAIDYTSSGELLTASAANNKYIAIPYDGMDIPTAAEAIIKKLVQQDSTTLNVAGNSIFTFNSHNPKNPITQKEINQYIFSVIKLVHETIPLTKIVSGGQTGADIAGAIAAAALGIPAVITFPKGFRQRNSYMGKDGKYAYKDVYRQSREDIREQIIDGATELVEPPFIDLTTVLENAKFAKGQRDSVVLEGSAENTGALSEAEILEGRTSQVKIAVLRNTVKGKYSIKSLYPNLVTHVPNMMIDTFGLPKGEQEPNRIFGSEAPISIVTDALATVGGLDTLVGKELNQSLTPELIAAYDSLLTVHPDAVAIMDKAILSPEDKQLNTAVTKLTYKAKKTPQEQAQLLSLKAQQQLIKDKRTLNPDDVLKVLNIGGLMAAMQVNLNNYLNQPFNPKWPDTILSFFKDNKRQLNRTNEGKVLNLVVANGDTYTYDQGLLESAALAAMQWLITASSYESIMDDAAIESYTGVSSEELSGNKAIAIQEGLSLTVAKNSLTTKIKKYWGFTSDNDADLAYQDGIAEAMASEILRGFIDIRLVAVNRIRLDQADGMRTPKDIDRFIITDFGDTLAGFPTAIDSAVLIEKDDVFFLDGDIPPVAKTQMNNPDVANSTDQLLAIEGENNTPYTMNVPVFNFFVAIGESGFRDAFGEGDTENRAMNVNDRMSAESVNKAASKMYKHMLNMATQLDNIANTTGKGIADVEIRYGHNSSSVNRLQQLGAYTPQSNKGIRELFLPTKSNLDLSGKNTIHTLAFHLGVAQALGIKVQKGTQEEAYTAVRELLSGPLAPALTLVQDWVNENDLSKSAMDKVPTSFDVSKLITTFKEANTELSVVGVHALIEFARLQNIKDKSNFTTQLYVEADGVTNGPINAMMLMTTGEFTEGFLEAVSRGGISFGEARPMSMMPKVDMYETSTINTLPALTSRIGLFNGMKGGKALVKNVEAVLRLLNLTMADISYAPNLENNGTGTLTLKRGAAKNPLTITIYGSSAAGIASKIVGILIKEVYASMSEAAQREARAKEEGIILSKAEAYFPNDKNADAKFRELTMTLGMLSSSEIIFNKRDKTYFLKDLPIAVTPIDSFEKFTFSYAEIKAIKANLLYAYVEPMVQGIEETVGKELIETTVLLRTGVQAQSVIYAAMYKQAIDDVIAERLVNDPTFKKGDFLSKNDLAAINQKLKKFAPLLESDMHNFLVTKSKELETESHSYSRALNGTMRTAPNLHIPADAGVAAVAYLTIGMGDGAMMVLLAKDGSVTGTLKVFDGMNMPLDKLHDYSLKANEAVYESYKGNPLREAGKSLSLFLEQKDEIRDFLVDEKKRIDADSLKNNNPDSSSIPSTTNRVYSVIERYTEEDSDLPIIEQVLDGLFTILYEMTGAAKSIDARHKAMRELSMAVDQMASVGSAYSNGVTGITSETPRSVVVEKLNERYKHHMAMPFDLFSEPENNNEEDAQEEVAPITATAITDISVPTKSGARLLNWNNVKNLAKSLGLTPEQKAIYDQITRAFGKSEYKVISGTFAEIAQYQKDNNLKGIDPSEASTTHGYISVGDQTIYLINPTAETLVHELIHAATYNIVLAHYMGKPNNPEATAAILDMEKLMSEFMAVSPDSLSNGKERQAFESAQATIENYQNQFSQEGDAAALNEFMAWSLANSEIASRLKSSKTQQDLRTVKNGKIRTLAKDAVKKIKEMIWGKKRAIPVGMDMLSNIQFNTAILVHLQQDMGSMVQSALLQHAVKGSSDRLTQVRIAMQQKVGMHIKAANTSALTAQSPEIMNALIQATNHALDVAAEFPMTPSEQSTFVSYVYAMATQAQIDPSIMVKAQELYSHVGKTLQVSDFMPENPQDRDAAYYEATQKFNIIMGKTFRKYDATGRSSILPTFIALATVNEDFRKILGNMKTPKYIKDTSKTMDGVLDNFGNYAMDQLSGYLSGTTNSVNVQQAIDALNFKLYENAIEEQSYLETIGDQIGGKVDTVNDIIVGKMAEAAEYGFNLGNKLTSTNTLAGKASGALVKMVSALISEQKGDVVAQSVISLINKGKINKTIHELVNEMIGRTEDNASIYDLNKIIKSTVHQIRQQFREEVPQIIADKFSRTLKAKEWTALYRGLGKTDIAVLLGSMDIKSLVNLLSNQSALDLYIKDLEQLISAKDMANWPTHQKKMMQLANYMNTKNPGNFLLRNAEAIAYLAGMPKLGSWRSPTQDTIGEMDNLISLYAFISLKKGDKDSLVSLLKSETKGIEYSLNYLKGQRDGELSKVQSGKARMNHYKGDMPSTPQQGMSLIVAKDSDFTSLTTRGYSRIGSYTGSTLDPRKVSYGYYFSPFPAKMAFSQGMMQNIKHTISGVDDTYGFSTDMVAGRITEPALVKAITKRILKDPSLVEQFMPIFDDAKNVFAYERSFDPKMMAKLNKSEHLAKMIAIWRGRQVEEKMSQTLNEGLITKLHEKYQSDTKASIDKKAEYVNLLDPKSLDVIERDAVSLFSDTTLNFIKNTYGEEEFWVRKDMLKDVIGFRNASLTDPLTGSALMTKETQDTIRRVLIGFFGVDIYNKILHTEQFLQNAFSEVRTNIVVKSVIVPVANMISNVYQLISRGVPLKTIARQMPKKLLEIEYYTKSRLRQVELEADLRAIGDDMIKGRRISAELRTITDSFSRLSIWPLIQAGEFSTVADVGNTADDLELSSGKYSQWFEKQLEKAPDGVRTMARYGYVARDTSLFQGLQKAVQYGDFIAKAVLYDDLTERKKLTSAEALGRITDEFINYDRLAGRTRAAYENMGMTWFLNYKIRIAKIALSTLRNNPLHALIAGAAPMPMGIGTPIMDNIFSKAMEDTLGYSLGPSMALHAASLNPWVNLTD